MLQTFSMGLTMKRCFAFLGVLCAVAVAGCSHAASVPAVQTDGFTAHSLQLVPGTQHPARQPNSLISVNGAMYGTTISGGGFDFGEVFSATTAGQVTALYSPNVGDEPSGRLSAYNKNLYGMTITGTLKHPDGMVFGISQTTGAQNLAYYFAGPTADGATPAGGLRLVSGTLYGTTSDGGNGTCEGGVGGCGTLFSVNPTTGAETVLYNFQAGSTDGQHPNGDLIYLNGMLYGTTYEGGAGTCFGGCGAVFSYNIATNQESIVYSFQNNGTDLAAPNSGLTNVNGLFYGTTSISPKGGGGVFEIDPSADTETVVYQFPGHQADGNSPEGDLTYLNGIIYGTTVQGGSTTCGTPGCGTVFQINLSTGKENVLYHFKGNRTDGRNPLGGVVAVNGALYGTTEQGGEHDRGTLFSLSLTGTETLLYNF